MNRIVGSIVTAAGLLAAAVAGAWIGQRGLVSLPFGSGSVGMDSAEPKRTGAVIYYRDPVGRPYYSLTPKRTDDGKDYVPVLASEDVTFDEPTQSEQAQDERKIKFYRNPMGLPDTSPSPKKDSMGMDYIPVYEGEDTDDGSVKVSLGKVQRTGVETTLVGKHAITRTIKAPGVVELDERRSAVVAPRFDGFVERVFDITTGKHVKKGDPLALVFGQDLLNQGARLLIEETSGARGNGGFNALKDSPVGVIGAVRRLQNLGAPEEFIEQIKRDRRVPDIVTVRAPIDGVVLERNVVDGQSFKAGEVAFRIADHSVVWILADVPEGDINALTLGQSVSVMTRAHPGRTFKGTVSIVYPHLMKDTRTARVRIELPNPDLALLPDMYGDVEIATGSNEDVVAVPTSAVIDSGTRQVVLRDQGDGHYEPREVKLGRKGDGFIELLTGVAEGDKVVVNGNFLIDAESNLQAALKGFTAPLFHGGNAMIARLIAWSAKNLMLVFIATAFAVVAGIWALKTLPLDAIPDLSDTQVIVYTEFPGQAPQVVEDQVTYPLTTSMLTVPRSKVVRGFSFFGVSFVYVIFADGTDIYWARSRVLEYLNAAAKRLPAGVTPTLGPDASGVGWIYQYALQSKDKSLAALRSLQDWEVRFGLSKAEGVAEVASVGGFVKQYSVVVDPGRLRSLNIPLDKIREVIRGNNMDVGGRTLELAEHEFMVRGRGYLNGNRRPREHRRQSGRRNTRAAQGCSSCRTRRR